MKKTYPLQIEGKNPERVLEAVKHDYRKYVKRERRRELPAGVDFWDFDCLCGADAASAQPLHLEAITQALDALVQAGGLSVFIAITAKPGVRKARV